MDTLSLCISFNIHHKSTLKLRSCLLAAILNLMFFANEKNSKKGLLFSYKVDKTLLERQFDSFIAHGTRNLGFMFSTDEKQS